MATDYRKFPVFTYSKPVSLENRDAYYSEIKEDFTDQGVNELKRFHTGQFHLSGKSYILNALPEINESAYESGVFRYEGFVYMECDHDHYMDRSGLNSWMLCRTIDGSGVLEYENRTYTLGPDDCFMVDCRQRHITYTAERKWHMATLHFNGKQCEDMFQLFKQSGSVVLNVKNIPTYDNMMDNILRHVLMDDDAKTYRVSSAIDTLLAAILAEKCRQPFISKTVYEIQGYIQRHYNERITLELLTKRFGISRAHLERLFAAELSTAPMKYLTEIRLSRAAALLRSTNLPVADVAESVGYNSTSGFINSFKIKYGCTPMKYRKENNAAEETSLD